MIAKPAKGSLDQKLITNVLCFKEGGIFATMWEVRMDIRPIDFNQEVNRVLDKVAGTVCEQGLIGVYFLARTSPSG